MKNTRLQTPNSKRKVNGSASRKASFANSKLPQEVDRSITPERVTQSIRMKYMPIRGLTPDRLTSYLDQWKLGFFRMAATTWDAMEQRDYQIKIVAPKRKKAVARHGYDVLSVDKLDDSQKELAQQQVEFLKYFYDHISVTTALEPDEQGGMSLLARQMMDAAGKRYAVHEIVWTPQADGNLTAKFIFCPLWWFEGTQGKLRFLENEFNIYGREMEDGGWLVTVHDGIMEACSVVYILKHLPLKSWVNFLDKFGMPGIHGKTDAQKGTKEWDAMVEAVQDFAEEWSAVTNREAEISLIEAKSASGSGSPFAEMVEKMDRAITQLWRGGDLGTSSSKDATGASLQQDESDILEGDDAVILEETLASRVSRLALQWKFGEDAPVLAYLRFKQEQDPNVVNFQRDAYKTFAANATISMVLANQADLKKLSQDVGLPINEEYEEPYLPLPQKQADQPAVSEDPELINESPAGAPTKAFEKNARDTVQPLIEEDLTHVAQRLAAIYAIKDDTIFASKLRAFLEDFPKLQKDLMADPAVARGFYQVLSTGVVNGLSAPSSAEVQNEESKHFINKCSCGKVIAQCRCAAPNKKITITPNGCRDCLAISVNQSQSGGAEKS